MKSLVALTTFLALFASTACTSKKAELGSAANPIKFYFIPSVDAKILEDTSRLLQKHLEATTPYKYKVATLSTYIAVVEAFGTDRVDVAALNTFGYVLAHDKYGAEALLLPIRYGETTYKSAFLAHADSGIRKLEDLNGKKIAFVDPASVSGYLLPLKYLNERGIKPKQTVFAMRHDNVVSMIYQHQVDAGAIFYSPPEKGEIQDARRLVAAQYPDVEKKVKIIELTTPIPNDPVVFRKDMPAEMKNAVVESMIKFAQTPDGLAILKKLSSITGFKRCTDKDFDSTRDAIRGLMTK